VLDMGDFAAIDTVVDAVTREMGSIQLVVNNAAVNWPGRVWDYDVDRYLRQFMVNLHGPWYLCRRVMPDMRAAGGGSIVNITTRAVLSGGGFGVEGVYAMTKGGMETMTRALAHDGGPYNIRVNTVSPAIVTGTKFIDDHPDLAERALPEVPLGRFPTADDVAEDVAFLLSDRARAVSGDVRSVNCGLAMRM
jgi:3-oxoacyl-[acyl-carrier protein] reductase